MGGCKVVGPCGINDHCFDQTAWGIRFVPNSECHRVGFSESIALLECSGRRVSIRSATVRAEAMLLYLMGVS
ncbi:hypothetical protein SAMN05421776_12236 [Nocardia farcinica]|uniref:Uncharacterized protein n=1 Tax=Nocardia farcinica TaxID=37329 RepID=A0A0H5NS27_NOCFR|nr:Uncharacterised protein [Nocardia farcinica]SIT34222.1 hypothetical protein SAMN05421776_12236 [Nocardia farcinica]